MMIGAVLIAMTVLAVLLTLWPLIFRKSIQENSNSEIEFYITQLNEIERDIERGLLPAMEAEAARAEMGRKLISLQKEKTFFKPFHENARQHSLALVFGLLLLPLLSAWLYSIYGHPGLRDMPLASRDDVENAKDPINTAIAKIEADIVAAPDNLKAWSTLAPVYLRLGRYSDAVIAYRKILQITGEEPSIRALLGEAEVAAANGIVTDEAKSDFTKALAADPTLAMARYYSALGFEQAGDTTQAITVYEALLDKMGDRPKWAAAIKTRLAALKGEAQPNPPQSQSSAPADNAMIMAMVNRLAARLDQDGGPIEDWVRLIRSYVVIVQKDNADQTLMKARKIFIADASATTQLHAIAKELGLPW